MAEDDKRDFNNSNDSDLYEFVQDNIKKNYKDGSAERALLEETQNFQKTELKAVVKAYEALTNLKKEENFEKLDGHSSEIFKFFSAWFTRIYFLDRENNKLNEIIKANTEKDNYSILIAGLIGAWFSFWVNYLISILFSFGDKFLQISMAVLSIIVGAVILILILKWNQKRL
jgi:uncharacterized membrane protein YeaQ/YmgE (transglycosylase-associated protein family)